uniref:Uncharacterized protein n=1 Tax=Aegilops tauschii subsp. strangulata TaxID=200361 RepID=A0A453KP46_AEGTS
MDQDVHVEGKSVPDFKSDSESSSGSKESSGQTQRGFRAAMDEIEITSGITLGPICLLVPLMSINGFLMNN